LLAGGALAAARAARLLGRATRWMWAVALLGALLLPAFAAWRPRAGGDVGGGMPTESGAMGGEVTLDALLARAQAVMPEPAGWAALDGPLAVAWALASLLLVARLASGLVTLRRAARGWEPATVWGAPVLVSRDVGPAVVGVRRGVVLPRWALRLDGELLRLMLAHEHEHLRAGDPWLLHAASLAVAVTPWNPVVWWLHHRLRLAVEIDCDRRVLRRHPGVAAYGALLLEVGRRTAGARPLPVAALLAPASSLERRIRVMTMRRPRRYLLQASALAVGTALVLVAACEAPRPTTPIAPERDVPLTSIEGAASRAPEGRRIASGTVRAAVARHVPELAESRSGLEQQVMFMVDSSGAIIQAEWAKRVADEDGKATLRMMPLLDANDIASVEIVKLGTGDVAPDPVGVIWVRLKGTAEDGRWRRMSEGGAPVASATALRRVPMQRGVDSGAARAVGAAKTRGLEGTPGELLYFVDGVEVKGPIDASVSPDRIESVEVLKGAAATERHGERGRNGVIYITTKKP
jgi:TonB-dependent SusC/RagA subfamily outer membrane receptor